MTEPNPTTSSDADAPMRAAIAAAAGVRASTSPNPWVGAVVTDPRGTIVGTGATEPPGGRHAEIVALDAAGEHAIGATLWTTLEPCCHEGRTGACTDRIIWSRVARVVVGVRDPDHHVAGRGIEMLRAAGIDTTVGTCADEIERQLLPYLHHRRTGRPYVVCKVAATLDGSTAAPDGTSQWITGEAARRDAHRLRAESDAIVVGAGTVRTDDPSLTVRLVDGRDPRRVVLGSAPAGARVHPCLEWDGQLDDLLYLLGTGGVVQVLVEGGSRVIGSFHDADLVDRYVVYLAPALLGGREGAPLIAGRAAPTITALRRGRIESIAMVGDDLRVDFVPDRDTAANHTNGGS